MSIISNMSIQRFTMGVNWPEIGCLMEVSIMFDMCTYCVFTLQDSDNHSHHTVTVIKSAWKMIVLINIHKTIFWYDMCHYCIILCVKSSKEQRVKGRSEIQIKKVREWLRVLGKLRLRVSVHNVSVQDRKYMFNFVDFIWSVD